MDAIRTGLALIITMLLYAAVFGMFPVRVAEIGGNDTVVVVSRVYRCPQEQDVVLLKDGTVCKKADVPTDGTKKINGRIIFAVTEGFL